MIGKGSGIVEKGILLMSPQTKIVTIDLNPDLNPDVVGDVRNLPFEDERFDVVLCCQILEHIPFSDIKRALSELRRVAKHKVIISVPHKRKHLKIEIDAPMLGRKIYIIKYPFSKKYIRSKQHCWEINRGVSYKNFKRVLSEFFYIEKTFLNEINCVHRFFVLKK